MLSMSELNKELKVKLRNQKFIINTVKCLYSHINNALKFVPIVRSLLKDL